MIVVMPVLHAQYLAQFNEVCGKYNDDRSLVDKEPGGGSVRISRLPGERAQADNYLLVGQIWPFTSGNEFQIFLFGFHKSTIDFTA